MELKQLLQTLSQMMGIPGYEHYERDALKSEISEYFDEYIGDDVGNHVFIRRAQSRNDNVPKLMIDAHFDEIGAIVTNVSDDGFLSVCAVGGLDRRTLPACEVTVYGANNQKIYLNNLS